MNRTLKRPMFRIGGSAGTGITSGLDQPRKQYNQGSNPDVIPVPADPPILNIGLFKVLFINQKPLA